MKIAAIGKVTFIIDFDERHFHQLVLRSTKETIKNQVHLMGLGIEYGEKYLGKKNFILMSDGSLKKSDVCKEVPPSGTTVQELEIDLIDNARELRGLDFLLFCQLSLHQPESYFIAQNWNVHAHEAGNPSRILTLGFDHHGLFIYETRKLWELEQTKPPGKSAPNPEDGMKLPGDGPALETTAQRPFDGPGTGFELPLM